MFGLALEGDLKDLGDVIEQRRIIIKGKRKRPILKVGAPRERPNGPGDGSTSVITNPPRKGKADLEMDLKADQEVDLSVMNWKDEMGNPATPPADVTVDWSVDEAGSDFVELVANAADPNGVTAGALGSLGNATVTGTVTTSDRVVTGDLLISVIAGDAERFEVTAGEPRERTADA